MAEWVIENDGAVNLLNDRTVYSKQNALPTKLSGVSHVFIRNQTHFTEADAEQLAKLPQLVHVEFSETTLAPGALRTLAKCRALQELRIGGGGTTPEAITEILEITQLRFVDMQNATIADELLARLGQLPHLEKLSIIVCPRVTAAGWIRLGESPPPKLKELTYYGNPISPEETRAFASLPRLSFLKLDNSELTDEMLAELVNCPTLAFLSMGTTAVSSEKLAEVQEALGNCTIQILSPEPVSPLYGPRYQDSIRQLMARGCRMEILTKTSSRWLQVDDLIAPDDWFVAIGMHSRNAFNFTDEGLLSADLPILAQLSDLQRLDVGKLPPEGVRGLLPLKNLTYLGIHGPLTEEEIGSLAAFPKLIELNAHIPSDEALGTIAKLPCMNHLKINYNSRVTDAGLERLMACRTLGRLTIDCTSITREAAQAFANDRPDVIVTMASEGRMLPDSQ